MLRSRIEKKISGDELSVVSEQFTLAAKAGLKQRVEESFYVLVPGVKRIAKLEPKGARLTEVLVSGQHSTDSDSGHVERIIAQDVAKSSDYDEYELRQGKEKDDDAQEVDNSKNSTEEVEDETTESDDPYIARKQIIPNIKENRWKKDELKVLFQAFLRKPHDFKACRGRDRAMREAEIETANYPPTFKQTDRGRKKISIHTIVFKARAKKMKNGEKTKYEIRYLEKVYIGNQSQRIQITRGQLEAIDPDHVESEDFEITLEKIRDNETPPISVVQNLKPAIILLVIGTVLSVLSAIVQIIIDHYLSSSVTPTPTPTSAPTV